jgi:hypothetical protein
VPLTTHCKNEKLKNACILFIQCTIHSTRTYVLCTVFLSFSYILLLCCLSLWRVKKMISTAQHTIAHCLNSYIFTTKSHEIWNTCITPVMPIATVQYGRTNKGQQHTVHRKKNTSRHQQQLSQHTHKTTSNKHNRVTRVAVDNAIIKISKRQGYNCLQRREINVPRAERERGSLLLLLLLLLLPPAEKFHHHFFSIPHYLTKTPSFFRYLLFVCSFIHSFIHSFIRSFVGLNFPLLFSLAVTA